MLKNKRFAMMLIFVGLAAIAAALVVVITRPASYSTDIPAGLDKAVSLSIFTREKVSLSDINADGEKLVYAPVTGRIDFYHCECIGEGHTLLGFREQGSKVEVFALCSLVGYGFRNGIFVDESGSSCVPMLITFEKTADGGYIYKDTQVSKDGGDFVPSVKKMFPSALAREAIDAQGSEEIVSDHQKQCDAYAQTYLKSIGRKAKISTFHAEDFAVLSDYGVSAEVSNELLRLHPDYGFYLGNFETVEPDGRHIWSVKWAGDDNGTGTVTYTRKNRDTGTVIEKFAYQVEGDTLTEVKPKKKK